MILDEDFESLTKERIPLKLLRVTPEARDGFILTDFPTNVNQAELLEEFRGGINGFINLNLPV